MKLAAPTRITTDILIIGSGAAGLRAAIEARRRGADVLVVGKSRAGYASNTAISGSAMAVALGRRTADTPDIQFEDTMTAGRLLNDPRMVRAMVQGAPAEIALLEALGVEFSKRGDDFHITSAPGHTNPRIVHSKRHIGTDLTAPLLAHAVKLGVRFVDNTLVTRLSGSGPITGALGLAKDGSILDFRAKATILACGGLGQLFWRTDNTADSTGDGYALAYAAGASLAGMEFVQFYPTALGKRGARGVSYEILVINGGATIRNAAGKDILESYGLRGNGKLTRDELSRCMSQEIARGGGFGERLALDLSTVPLDRVERIREFLPGHVSLADPMPVAPTVHYMMGGVQVDEQGRTGVEGLYAAGEVAAGTHGANRLVASSLPEALVLGAIAGATAANDRLAEAGPGPDAEAVLETGRLAALGRHKGTPVKEMVGDLQHRMWDQAGVIRNAKSLTAALAKIESFKREPPFAQVKTIGDLWHLVELGNMLAVSEMICRAALARSETRGAHFRQDYPEENLEWLRTITIASRNDQMMLSPQAKVAPASDDSAGDLLHGGQREGGCPSEAMPR